MGPKRLSQLLLVVLAAILAGVASCGDISLMGGDERGMVAPDGGSEGPTRVTSVVPKASNDQTPSQVLASVDNAVNRNAARENPAGRMFTVILLGFRDLNDQNEPEGILHGYNPWPWGGVGGELVPRDDSGDGQPLYMAMGVDPALWPMSFGAGGGGLAVGEDQAGDGSPGGFYRNGLASGSGSDGGDGGNEANGGNGDGATNEGGGDGGANGGGGGGPANDGGADEANGGNGDGANEGGDGGANGGGGGGSANEGGGNGEAGDGNAGGEANGGNGEEKASGGDEDTPDEGDGNTNLNDGPYPPPGTDLTDLDEFPVGFEEDTLPQPVPEPGSLLLMGTGVVGLLAYRRRKLARRAKD